MDSTSSWAIKGRVTLASQALRGYLDRLCLENFDVAKYTNALRKFDYAHVPTIGYAISGGGTASAYTGTGGLRAFDERIPGANEQRVGGLLQVITYMSGLSGGAWPTVGLATYDFLNADDVLNYWQPELNRENATVDSEYAATTESMIGDMAAKFEAGFNITAADFFGRLWGYGFVAPPQAGLNQTWSGIARMPAFQNFTMPMPIVEFCQLIEGNDEYYGLEVPYPNKTFVSTFASRSNFTNSLS